MNDRCGYLGSEGTLCSLFMRASQRIESRIENRLAGLGLSLAKLGVLEHLTRESGPLPLGRLAERLACVKSNMTQLVDRLESDGFVERVYDPQDRRSVLAAITREGLGKREAGNLVLVQEEADVAAKFSPAELNELTELLRKVE